MSFFTLLKKSFRIFVKAQATLSIVTLVIPAVITGTLLGYFTGEPRYSVWFFVAWPFIVIGVLLLAVYCVCLFQLRRNNDF